MIDYNIIATGSKGNAVVIDQKILIDCGVSFKALSKVYRALKLVQAQCSELRVESLAPVRKAVLLHRHEQFERHHGSKL